MEFKKIISLSAACMIMCSSVYAGGIDINKADDKVTVKAVIQSGEEALLRVVADGHGADEYGYVFAFDEAVADADGNIVFEFNMPESKNGVSSDGKYNVYIKSGSGIEKEGFFWYATYESHAALDELLSGADGDTLYEIVTAPENKAVLSAAGFAVELFDEVKSKTEICKKAASGKDVAKTFTELTVTAYVNEAKNADDIEKGLATANFEYNGVNFTDIEDEAVSDWVKNCILKNGDYSDFEELSAEYVKVNVLYEAQGTRFNKLKDLLKKYKDELGIDGEDEYEDFTDASDSVVKKVAEKISDTKPSTTNELLDIFEACLPKKSSGSSSGGSSGGGGYSSKVTNSLPALTVEPQPTKEPEKPVETKPEFSDMKDASWAETAVVAMAEKGIISGGGDGKFRPNDSVTREEFVKMIITASGKYDKNAVCDFADVDKSAWYASYVASGINSGIIKGVSDTEFGIGNTLTRQDMAVMCARALSEINAVREDAEFADEAEISDYAKESIHKLYAAGLINGTGENSFSPKMSATRAQAAQIIYNLFVK